jgi:ribosomal protein L37AE/L43A
MSLNQVQLLTLLEEVLGKYKEYKKQNEVAFYCPACGHHKKKLQVNLVTGAWHCWICQVDNHMAGKSIFTLFRRINATRELMMRLSEILGEYRPSYNVDEVKVIKSLPKEFKSLSKVWNSSHYKHAYHYITNRGVTFDDILKYNIGYAEQGDYSGKIIIPSYDSDGRLNFFVGRAFYHDDWRQHQMPEWSKDIVGFEAFINWRMPIVLVEGAFDAIAVKVNAVPLFGKTVSNFLHQQIIQNQVSDIYIALDQDAMRNSAKYIELFLGEGRTVYFVELKDKDPSKMGFEKMQEIIRSTHKSTFMDVMKLRLI